ncbi:MAG: ComEA family DNA-binding protein [Phycisphaerales bacterium]
MSRGLTGIAKWGAVALLGVVAVSGITATLVSPRVPSPTRPVPAEVTTPAVPAPAQSAGAESAQAKPVLPPVDPPAAKPNPTLAIKSTININTATQAELELLPGIGPAMAGRILEYRAQHGAFKSIADLDNVKGIGPKTLAKLTPLVRVTD